MDAFWHFLTQDWYFAIPMLGMSLVAVTLVAWRLLLNFSRHQHERVLAGISREAAKEGPEAAAKFCKSQSA